MLPQKLVQNKIIDCGQNQFKLNWSFATPILNLNFFHINSLVDGLFKYKYYLRPWEEVTTIIYPDDALLQMWSLKLHQYYISPTAEPTKKIFVGSQVGRISTLHNTPTDSYKDCLVLTSNVTYYVYDSVIRAFRPNEAHDEPSVFRPDYWALKQPHEITIEDMTHVGDLLQYKLSVDWPFNFNDANHQYSVYYSTDVVMCDIWIDGNIVARPPVTITHTWDTALQKYYVYLMIDNNDYPADAKVRFW